MFQNSFADIARLLSDFFRDLDVVPSDVVAGLVLLRKFQKIEREAIVKQVSIVQKILRLIPMCMLNKLKQKSKHY